MSVIIETSIGDFTIDLFIDERPKCCKNFLKLCKVKYYNFCLFHSVQRNFIAQTGDPTGTGKGGESIHGTLYGDQARYFDWEFVPKIKHVKPGLVSMVNNGHNMHGSQFFITLGNSLDYLDGVHTVFGEVTEGLEVITKLNEAYCDEKFRPFRDIRIHHTIILEDPFDDPPGLDMPDRSPSPTPEVIERARLAADAEIDEFEGLTEEEIREIMEEREEKSNAQILEMIGDLPSADVTAPENVLFVCKLNSVTTDEDLEIIFSRFGTIKSCEVIRDHKTGESLQYAFIEFERQEDCESAYFKMDNVLIDDRRIHVDFSQSVSKIKWKGKGKGVETINDEPKKPKYIIKDKSQRQDNNYDLVFGDDDDNKSSKKRHKERSHNKEDNYRHKKRQNHSRSRSPVDTRKRQRSPERERKNDRRRDEREDRYSSSPKNRGLRKSSSPRYRNERHMSPPRTRDKRYISPPRHGGSYSVSRNRDDKYSDFKNKDKSPSRKEERRQEKRNYRSDSEETRGKERLKNKKRRGDSSEDDKSSERKKELLRHTEISDSEEEMRSRKKNKHANMSDEEKEKRKKMKKKKKNDSSDENEDVDDEKRKKKKKKKHQSISEDESTADDKHESRKRKKGDSKERQIYKNRNSESPPGRKSDKHNSVNYKNSSREEKTKYRDNDRDEYKYRR